MTVAVLPNRFNDDEYKNWLKSTHSLLCLRNGIEKFVQQETKSFHLLLKSKLQGEKCNAKCTPQVNKFQNPCSSCKKWVTAILSNSSINNQQIHWKNTDPPLWPKEEWEVAKVYMPRGQTKHKKVSDFDIAALLNFVQNCKHFHSLIKGNVNKVIQVRNILMHSALMKVKPADMHSHIDTVLDFINQLLTSPHLATDSDLNKALENVKELQNTNLHISLQGNLELGDKNMLDLEMQCFKEKIEELRQQMEEGSDRTLKECLQDVQELKEFMNNNKDLSERLGTQLELLNHVAEKVKEHDQKLERLSEAVNVHEEDIVNLDKRVQVLEDSTEISGFSSSGEMYKNRLFELTQIRDWPPPKFSEKYGKKGGYIGVVEVNKIKYEGREEHKAKVSSHQAVAKIALCELGQISEDVDASTTEGGDTSALTEGLKHLASVSVNLNKTIETAETYTSEKEAVQMAYFELARRLQLQGQNSDSQTAVEDFFSDLGCKVPSQIHVKMDDKRHKCHLTIVGDCTFQSKDGRRKLKDAEQEAAKIALQNLAGIFEWSFESINPSNDNFKGKLQELLIKSGHGVPTYKGNKSDLILKETSLQRNHASSAAVHSNSDYRSSEQAFISTAVREAKGVTFEKPAEQPVGECDAESTEQSFPFHPEDQQVITDETRSTVSSAVNEHDSDIKRNCEQSAISPAAPLKTANVASQPLDEHSKGSANEESSGGPAAIQAEKHESCVTAIPFFSEVTVELQKTFETQEVYPSREMAMLAVYSKLKSAFQLQASESDYANSKEEVLKFFNTSHYKPPEENYEETSDNKFKCKLELSGKFSFRNKEGASRKKAAEHEAAKTALTHLASIFDWRLQPTCKASDNYKGMLQELLMQSNHSAPAYKDVADNLKEKETASPSAEKASASPNKPVFQTDTKPITSAKKGSKIQAASHNVDNTTLTCHATKTVSKVSLSPSKPVLQTDTKPITSTEEGPKIQDASHNVENAAIACHATKTVSKVQHVLEKFPPKFTYAYDSEVTVHLKEFKTETSLECRAKKEATRAAYKSFGKALGILDENADATTAASKVNEFLVQNGYQLPEEIISGNFTKFESQLIVTCSFSCHGKGSSFVQAQEQAAKQAVLQLTCILGRSSNSMAVSADGHKQLLSNLLQEHSQEAPVYKDEYKHTASINFTNFVIESQKKWNNKKLAHTEVALRLLGLLGLPLQEKGAKNYAQEWFQERRLSVPKYTECGNGSEGFVGKVTFSACMKYSVSEPQFTEELSKEKLLLEVQRHLEFIVDKDIQLNQT
ncbi:uncharacterized protein LOC122802629 isoform X2 [Protopterus annectens]|uniref:uncharacterized protein LOC122802629 isoform X2 n=1 Tax=Protopterus annectens TaxID=7888 RepID=UPI001CFA73CA|nr:uncharacterized protein LOC122802629 isoform X2 [Protopterus annectens]